MQQRPLLEAKSLSVLNRSGTSLDPLDRTSRTAGPPFQGLTAPDIQSHSEQSQPSRSSHVVQDNCSGQESYSTSTSHPGGEEVEMDTSPTTPSGRGISAPSVRPPDAPRKSKQTRPPIQLSPNAPVRKLDFDSNPFRLQSISDSEQSCDSRHSGPGRG